MFLSQLYLNSNDARLVATELACRTMKPHRRLPKALVPSIASALDAWAGTTEEVRVNFVPKGSDPDDRRMPLLRAIAHVHPHQFGTAYIACSLSRSRRANLKR